MERESCFSLTLFALLSLVVVSSAVAVAAQTALGQTVLGQQDSLDLEVLIFSDGSAFLQGEASSDPSLFVSYKDGKISGVTSKLTSKTGETWHFSIKTENSFQELSARFVLPENARLITSSVKSNSLPLIHTQGKSLVIIISDSQKPLDLSFSYELEPNAAQKSNFPIMAIYFAAIVIAAFVVFFILKKRRARKDKSSWQQQKKIKRSRSKENKEKKKESKEESGSLSTFRKKFEAVKQTLNEREVKILDGLIELEGKAKQNQLQKFTGIPKAAFSRHIASLEAKNLISKKSLGRVNLIQAKSE